MSRTERFNSVSVNVNKFETRLEKYLLESQIEDSEEKPSKFLVLQDLPVKIKETKICLWEFMDKESLEAFMKLEKRSAIRKRINLRVEDFPKGQGRTIFLDLMYNVTKYCKKADLALDKCGATLSQFYLTHIFFTSNFDTSAEKVFMYFKELTLNHSVPFPPTSIKLFSHKEATEIMQLFCKLYLRNLPLIRFLCLPNFAFYVNYELPPEPELKSKKDKAEKGKKGKK